MLYVAETNRHVSNALGVSSVITLCTSTGTPVDGRSRMVQPHRRAHRGGRVPGDVGCSPALYHEPEESQRWPLETIEIDASLPKLKKAGWLRAIRRTFQAEKPRYDVLEIAGDRTVKNQVIARYLSATERATDLPVSSVAITSANYAIHYAGRVRVGERPAYVFRITPRKKREGLLNAVLWLDSETGIAVRESGYLAKSPSVFVKRVNLTRENELHNGTIEARITHIVAETRLIGPARLVIVERPASDELAAPRAAEGK